MPGRNQFPRRERLTRRRDYLSIYQQGEKRVGRQFVCYTVRREGQGRKIGLAVSRKVGKAVVRNRVKRYIREVYRTHRGELSDDMHVIVVARPASASLDYSQCAHALRQLLSRGTVQSG
ncbi:MAG: ribonuclease P protein component [Candidatus Hydrogenedentes bacterium]|nr:ribonuclease P protein component [Candidatus Hydrogenedentota bacterium]